MIYLRTPPTDLDVSSSDRFTAEDLDLTIVTQNDVLKITE